MSPILPAHHTGELKARRLRQDCRVPLPEGPSSVPKAKLWGVG